MPTKSITNDEIKRLQDELAEAEYQLAQSRKTDLENGSMSRAYLEADVRVSRETIEHQKLEIQRLNTKLKAATDIVHYVTQSGRRAKLMNGVYSYVPDELISAWLKAVEEGSGE